MGALGTAQPVGSLRPSSEEAAPLLAGDDEDESDARAAEILYWREELERWVDGIAIQVLVILLALLDISLLVAYTLILPPDEGDAQFGADHGQTAAGITVLDLPLPSLLQFPGS